MKQILVLFAALLSCSPACAEVVRSAAAGFEIRVEALVDSSSMGAYEQFLAIGEWWDPDHSWFGRASGFTLDARAGGCFCEHDGDRSALHMTVSFVDPGKQVSMVGGLGPLQGLGLHGAMSWTFEPVSDREARVIHVYRVTGYYPSGLQGLAAVVDAVQTGQVNRLKARLAGTL